MYAVASGCARKRCRRHRVGQRGDRPGYALFREVPPLSRLPIRLDNEATVPRLSQYREDLDDLSMAATQFIVTTDDERPRAGFHYYWTNARLPDELFTC